MLASCRKLHKSLDNFSKELINKLIKMLNYNPAYKYMIEDFIS